MPYGLLAMYSLMMIAGVSILYWSGPVSRASDVLTRYLAKKFPALNKLRWTSEEFNLKHSRTCVRIFGALLFAFGTTFSLGVFLFLSWIRFHLLPSQIVTLPNALVYCFGMFAILFVVAFLRSRIDVARQGEIKDTTNLE